jgi:hypothetical protein
MHNLIPTSLFYFTAPKGASCSSKTAFGYVYWVATGRPFSSLISKI